MILDRFSAQLTEVRVLLEQAEAMGAGVQVVFSAAPGGVVSAPKVTVFPRLTATKPKA